MKAHVAIENGECQAHPCTAVSRAIHWLQNYINKNPYTDAAKEARSIIYGLEAVRKRPALDELLALIGQIAKSDLGLEEINRARIRMSQPGRTTDKPMQNPTPAINRAGVNNET
jgi:hypothetical protein